MDQMIKGIIFDLSGTLAYRVRPISYLTASKMLRKMGYDVWHQEWEAAYRFVFFVEYPKGRIRSYEDFLKRTFQLLHINPSKRDLERIVRYYKRNDRFRFFPDVKYARKIGLKKAILTTIARFRFDFLDLSQFDPVMTGSEIGRAKPHPAGFLKIIKKWKLKPSEVLVVGDEPDLDIFPAKELGFQTLLIDRNNKHPGWKFKRIRDLKALSKLVGV